MLESDVSRRIDRLTDQEPRAIAAKQPSESFLARLNRLVLA
jgi:hypothetical protein